MRQGIEIAGVLVDASKESPMDLDDTSENDINNKHIEDDEEDTLEEAPSIVDEALGKEASSRSSTGGSASSSGSAKNWNKADNIRTSCVVDQKLKGSLYEGQEVAKILHDAKTKDEEDEEREKAKPGSPPPPKRNPLSHFRAMALVGKLFFDFKKTKPMTPLTEVHPEDDSSSTPTESSSTRSSSTDRPPRVRIQREQSPSPGAVSPEHDSFYSDGSSGDENVERQGLNIKKSSRRSNNNTSSRRSSQEVSSSSTRSSKLKSKAENVKVMVEADHKMKDMMEEGKEISNTLIDEDIKNELIVNDAENQEEIDIDLDDPEVGKAAVKIQSGFKGHQARKQVKEMKDEQNKVTVNEEEDVKTGNDNHSASSDDSKNWSTEGNVRGDVTKDKKDVVEASDKKEAVEDQNDQKVEEDDKKKPPVSMGGFRSHFKALGMLRMALRKKVLEKADVSSSSESECSETSISESSQSEATESQPSRQDNSQSSFGDKTKAEKSDHGLSNSVQDGSKSNVPSSISPEGEADGMETGKVKSVGFNDDSGAVNKDFDEDVDEDVLEAALIIQSGYRGMKARAELRGMKKHRESYPNPPKIIIDSTSGASNSNTGATDASSSASPIEDDDEDDERIEMTDEVIDAATSILAAFRGRQARREVEKMKREMQLKFANAESESEEEESEEERVVR